MEAHGERFFPTEPTSNTEMILALLSHSEELRKGKGKAQFIQFMGFLLFMLQTSVRKV